MNKRLKSIQGLAPCIVFVLGAIMTPALAQQSQPDRASPATKPDAPKPADKPVTANSNAPSKIVPSPDKPVSQPDPKPDQIASEDEVPGKEEAEAELETETILGTEEERKKIAGAAFRIDEKQLERFEYDDINRVLRGVPGVNIREEDGYGLRPNIGIRGVAPDRSAKLTLMEDGVLFGPAPYAAPAAYYFPMTTRMTNVEVFKGPSAIKYGPNTIAGAINLTTRPIPEGFKVGVDVAGGSYKYRKTHAYVGASNDNFGVLIEGVTLGSDGFKSVDGGGNTGFVKSEGMLKLRANTDPTERNIHQLDVKLGYSTEISQETYLGVSHFDFRQDPYRRYLASRQDRFDWWRSQLQLDYTAFLGEDIELKITGYRHDFRRDWRRLAGFRNGPALRDVLANPSTAQNAIFYGILTGEQDSANNNQALIVTNNDRRFLSQGLQGSSAIRFETGDVEHELNVGLRLHFDSIRRHHEEEGFLVTNRTLVSDGLPSQLVVRNTGEALATAFYVQDELTWQSLTLTPGIRIEHIRTKFTDYLTATSDRDTQTVILPGIGAFYEVVEGFGVLAGVHRGFSPVAPGQGRSGVDPELSINNELGLRAWGSIDETHKYNFELIGFFNHYSELIADATFSSGANNTQIGNQTNAGEVNIYGLETSAYYEFLTSAKINFSISANYTLTVSEFLESFVSSDPTLGVVREGDRLPYVPRHQGQAVFRVFGDNWDVALSATYIGKFYETAARRNVPATETVNDVTIFDLAANYRFLKNHTVYFRVNNLTNEKYVAARRPFGSRPGAPLTLILGYKFDY